MSSVYQRRTIDSPLGPLQLVADDEQIVAIGLNASEHDRDDSVVIDQLESELNEYFSGDRTVFSVRLGQPAASPFGQSVLKAVARVTYGKVATYSDMAQQAGNPQAVRAAASAIANNPLPIVIPCHRILARGPHAFHASKLKYAGGASMKQQLLELEGIRVIAK